MCIDKCKNPWEKTIIQYNIIITKSIVFSFKLFQINDIYINYQSLKLALFISKSINKTFSKVL